MRDSKQNSARSSGRQVVSAALGAAIGMGGALFLATGASVLGLTEAMPVMLRNQIDPFCKIKGNISINSGKKIYHVPGQEFYSETIIRPTYGERWFCSEQEARAAGWRRARS